jgi:hypothetical protein
MVALLAKVGTATPAIATASASVRRRALRELVMFRIGVGLMPDYGLASMSFSRTAVARHAGDNAMGLLDALGLELPKNRATGAAGPTTVTGGQTVPPVTAQSKAFTDYAAERLAVKKLVDELKAHPQKSRIATQLAQIGTKLDAAAQDALKGQWPTAMASLADARALCATAKKLADDWQAFLKKKANTLAQTTAVAGLDNALLNTQQTIIAQADAKVAASPPDFASANTLLDGVYAKMKPYFKGRVDSLKAQLTKVEGMAAPVPTYLQKPIADGKALVTQAEAALASEDWSQALISWRAGWGVIGPLERYGQRRLAYETQRTTTLADVQAVKAVPEIRGKGPGLDAAVAIADDLATLEKLKLEEGAALLKDVSARGHALTGAAPTIAAYAAQRGAAMKELEDLGKHAAAAQLAAPLEAIRQLLATAKSAADLALKSDHAPLPPWQAALAAVQRARLDLGVAKKLADNLGSAAGAQAAAAGGDVAAMKQALARLKTDLASAAAAPYANVAKQALERAKAKTTDSEAALNKGDAKGGAAGLAAAGQALTEARTVESRHAQFVATLASVEARFKALQALPTAKSIAARIDTVAKALDAARKQDQNAAGDAAMAALWQATDAAAAAEQADRDRRAFDAEAKRVRDRIAAEVSDAKLAKSIDKTADDAVKLADAFKFAEAERALKNAEVQIGEVKLKAGMKTTPPDPKLSAIAAEMVSKGGAHSVDRAIQAAPDSDPKVILALASGRYGKPFTFKEATPGPQQVKAMKRVCEVFAKIPDDLAGNPSIKDVQHEDAVGSAGGGYTSSTAHIGMSGRVGIQQEFGNDETNRDPKSGKDVKSLPKDLDPACKPKGGKIEYLGFAAAHEVGHGVDDKRGFMAKNGAGETYGGWINYGASVQPVADAVGAHIAGKFAASAFYKNAATKAYVLDKLMSKPAQRPNAAIGSDDFKALDAFDTWHALATADDVYRRQSDCDAIQIGDRIYHEAYPRRWVSYLAAARKKGMTGYQFRAPGEWFAELYACWKTKKLGDKHPALEWLTKL